MSRSGTLESQIKARAKSLGFSIAGITDASPLENYPVFQQWIKEGNHAGMAYLQSRYHQQSRISPADLLPGTRSVIVLGLPYPLHPLERLSNSSVGLVSGYAVGEDYHHRIPELLTPLVGFLHDQFGKDSNIKVYSDNTPILERELAVRAGMGWIGKNSCLISPEVGSTVLLAEIFLDRPLEPDSPFQEDRCGTCQNCIQACPTSCILSNRTIDARRCISYHTIENRGSVPGEIMTKQGNWVFGCDICQMVCPWNRKSADPFQTRMLTIEQMQEYITLPSIEFLNRFSNSAVQRAKPHVLRRNLLVALSNADAFQGSDITKALNNVEDQGLVDLIAWLSERKN